MSVETKMVGTGKYYIVNCYEKFETDDFVNEFDDEDDVEEKRREMIMLEENYIRANLDGYFGLDKDSTDEEIFEQACECWNYTERIKKYTRPDFSELGEDWPVIDWSKRENEGWELDKDDYIEDLELEIVRLKLQLNKHADSKM